MPNSTTSPILCFKELLIARLMLNYSITNNALPRQVDLFDQSRSITIKSSARVVKGGMVNEFINDHNIPPLFMLPISGNPQLQRAIGNLREAGLLAPHDSSNPRARYQWRDIGAVERFVNEYAPLYHWRQWALTVIVDPRTLTAREAHYYAG